MKYLGVNKPWALLMGAIVPIVCFASFVFAECPSAENVQEGMRKFVQRDITVVKVQPSVIGGLCEVQYRMSGPVEITYTDPTGKYFVTGQILDIQKEVNITKQNITNLNRLTPEEMKRLESLTAFTMGKSEKFLYYATDPQCPYCKKGEAILKKLIDGGELTVKFVLYPLPMHKGADEQCVSILCDKKGLEEFMAGYKSSNQCPEGKKKIEDTIAFMNQKGLSATPAYIFPDGTYHLGALNEQDVMKRWKTPDNK